MTTDKLIDRIKKLLMLTTENGATEAEAALAAERAAGIMAEHGLSIAQVEASGGVGEGREDLSQSGGAQRESMVALMEAIGKTMFVYVVRTRRHDGRRFVWGYRLIGRESAVASTRVTFEYLRSTVGRLARERGTPADERFKDGLCDRLRERVLERHEQRLLEQEEDARRRREAAGGTANALVVVLSDYAESEECLNLDRAHGLKPGTTAAKRVEARRVREEHERRFQQLRGEGVEYIVAWYMAYADMDRQRAEELAAAYHRASAKESRGSRGRSYWKAQQRANHPSYQEGRRVAENVGLDTQVGRDARRNDRMISK